MLHPVEQWAQARSVKSGDACPNCLETTTTFAPCAIKQTREYVPKIVEYSHR
jgi:hypothetical protein